MEQKSYGKHKFPLLNAKLDVDKTPNFFPKKLPKPVFFFQKRVFSARKRVSTNNTCWKIFGKKLDVLFASNLL